MSLDRPTRSAHLLQTDRRSEDRQSRANVDLYDNAYLASFGRKFIKIAF